jgi:hypothetical protein
MTKSTARLRRLVIGLTKSKHILEKGPQSAAFPPIALITHTALDRCKDANCQSRNTVRHAGQQGSRRPHLPRLEHMWSDILNHQTVCLQWERPHVGKDAFLGVIGFVQTASTHAGGIMVHVATSQVTSSNLCNTLKPIADRCSDTSASTCSCQYGSWQGQKSLTLSRITIPDPCFLICLIPSRINP